MNGARVTHAHIHVGAVTCVAQNSRSETELARAPMQKFRRRRCGAPRITCTDSLVFDRFRCFTTHAQAELCKLFLRCICIESCRRPRKILRACARFPFARGADGARSLLQEVLISSMFLQHARNVRATLLSFCLLRCRVRCARRCVRASCATRVAYTRC